MGNSSTLRKIRKGDLVMLDPNDPEISRLLEWPNSTAEYLGARPTTQEEREEWRDAKRKMIADAFEKGEDTFSLAFNSAGESILAPRSVSVSLPVDRIYIVERARCRVELGWGNAQGGMTRILDTNTGEHAYVRRDMLKIVDTSCNTSNK